MEHGGRRERRGLPYKTGSMPQTMRIAAQMRTHFIQQSSCISQWQPQLWDVDKLNYNRSLFRTFFMEHHWGSQWDTFKSCDFIEQPSGGGQRKKVKAGFPSMQTFFRDRKKVTWHEGCPKPPKMWLSSVQIRSKWWKTQISTQKLNEIPLFDLFKLEFEISL